MSPYLRAMPLLILLGFVALAATSLLVQHERSSDTQMLGQAPDAFSLPPMEKGNPDFSFARWKGQAVIVNVFASWCIPCAEEHASLMELAAKTHVPIIGIAWRDKEEAVARWVKTRGNPYRELFIDKEGKSTLPLGLSGVPETFVIAPNGTVAYNYKGGLNSDLIDSMLLPLLKNLAGGS